MAMDFFESQEAARRKTGRLVLLFLLAVLAIIFMVYVVVAMTVSLATQNVHSTVPSSSAVVDWPLLGIVSLCTLVVVSGGSIYRIAQLSGGGTVVAEMLGGRPVRPDTTDTTERKVLNVVEEMAIASGIPAPPVYLLDEEEGINAFAAGFSPSDAVIGITRGCAERLARDELQGVVGHEFSHILNGDMRLNIRLIGVLHGVLVIGIIGYFILRSAFRSGHVRTRSGRGKGNPLPIIALGAGLMVIGYVGTFFGSMIKAAVSRQREFLADASAVQFTRHPDGIAGALKKIGGLLIGSRLDSPNAAEASHLLFAQGVPQGLTSVFATHPPLRERILRIDPSWDGKFVRSGRPAVAKAGREERAPTARAAAGFAAGLAVASAGGMAARRDEALSAVLSRIGRPTEAHVRYAATLVEGLPAPVAAAAREPYGARALIYALLMSKDEKTRRQQTERLAAGADAGVFDATIKLLPAVHNLDARVRLPLIDMTLPALRALSASQYETFDRNVRGLVEADERIDLFEWTLQRILLRHLKPQFTNARPPRAQVYALRRLQRECEVLLAALAYVGHPDREQAADAFTQAASHLGLPRPSLPAAEQCGLNALDAALDALSIVAPRLKRQLLEACAICVGTDRKVTLNEAELLRAIADSLDCPMPPLLPGEVLE